MTEDGVIDHLLGRSIDAQWKGQLALLLGHGERKAPRELETIELCFTQTRVDMRHPVVLNPLRKMGYKFMCAEAAWILRGDNRVMSIEKYSKAISNFSDDGIWFRGSYGPPVLEQLQYVVNTLVDDPESRQAVLSIWRPRPGPSRDVPCTVSMQFMIRRDLLHCLVNMRSSDAWLGWPYDQFNFSCISAVVAAAYSKCRGHRPALQLGTLVTTMGSSHLYSRDQLNAEACSIHPVSQRCEPLEIDEWMTDDYTVLIELLEDVANGIRVEHGFLSDVSSIIASREEKDVKE